MKCCCWLQLTTLSERSPISLDSCGHWNNTKHNPINRLWRIWKPKTDVQKLSPPFSFNYIDMEQTSDKSTIYYVINLILPVNLTPLWVVYSRYMEDHGVFHVQVVTETNLVCKWYSNVAGFQDEHYVQGFSWIFFLHSLYLLRLWSLFYIIHIKSYSNSLKRNKMDEDFCIICFEF